MLWLAIILLTAVAADPVRWISIDPPLTQCAQSTLSWQGGEPPYWIQLHVDGVDRNLVPLTNETSYNWTCDYTAGSKMIVYIKDSTGVEGIDGVTQALVEVVRQGSEDCSVQVSASPAKSLAMPTVTTTVLPEATNVSSKDASTSKKSTPVGQIVGGVVGGVVGLLIILGLLFWNWRLRRQLQGKNRNSYQNIEGHSAPASGAAPAQPPANDSTQRSDHIAPTQPVVDDQPRASAPEPSPETKMMQLDAMLAAQPSLSAQRPSPGMSNNDRGNVTQLPYSSLGLTSAPTTTQELSSGQPLDHESEYAEDAGPAFAPPPRTVHPPQYSDTWKN